MSKIENRKEEKRSLRRRMLSERGAMSITDAAKKSCEITKRILETAHYRHADCIYVYIDTRNEYQTKDLIEHAWKFGKRVAVPRVEEHEMSFYYIQSWSDLEEGFRGIREPNADCMLAQEEEALMILPGVAYDICGNRLGYGGGFYDRYLSVHNKHFKLAPAYEFQVMETLPTEPFDQKVPYIVTEKQTIDLSKRRK